MDSQKASPSDQSHPARDAESNFPPTRWSLIATLQDGSEESAKKALGEVFEAYWYPLYVFARQSGRSREQSEDLVQGFFERLIAHSSMTSVEPGKGKLRSFFMASFKKHLADAWRRDSAIKRGGGKATLSIEGDIAEEQFQSETRKELTPEQIYDRRWALTVLDRVMQRLRDSYASRNQGERFDLLKDYLEPKSGQSTYAEAAARLDLTENAFQQAVFRLREKYRELLENEIADTVGDSDQVQDELRYLIAALGL